jgi:hypothetical protein
MADEKNVHMAFEASKENCDCDNEMAVEKAERNPEKGQEIKKLITDTIKAIAKNELPEIMGGGEGQMLYRNKKPHSIRDASKLLKNLIENGEEL